MIPDEALRLVKHFEGIYLRSYLCPAGVWTIGWGSTGTDIGPGMAWTIEQCERRLIRDLAKCENDALRYSPTLALDDRKLSAIISFIYNLGAGAYQRSTLRRRINEGDWELARREIKRWNKAGGVILRGLIRRREAEAALL